MPPGTLHPPRSGHSPIELPDTQPWVNIYTMEVTSNECLSKGNEAQTFIDFLDKVLARSSLDENLRKRSLRLISKICKAHEIIPASYILQREFIRVGRVYYRGGFADVSKGEYFGRPVAIKRLKMNEGESERAFRIIDWKHLSHPNILPLLGVSVSANSHCFRILSEWMPNGNVMQYSRSNPKANRLRLLSEIAFGVTYIHELRIVHGDLKGANILVDNRGSARVADFGLVTVVDLSTISYPKLMFPPGGHFAG